MLWVLSTALLLSSARDPGINMDMCSPDFPFRVFELFLVFVWSWHSRTVAELIGETLVKQRLKSNYGKTKYVILGSEEFKERTRQEAAVNPIKMGSHIIEESKEVKYLGDQIHTDGLEASITSTINKWIYKCLTNLTEIINLSENPRKTRMGNSRCALCRHPVRIWNSNIYFK